MYSEKPELLSYLQVDLANMDTAALERITAERATAICQASIDVVEYLRGLSEGQGAAVFRAQLGADRARPDTSAPRGTE